MQDVLAMTLSWKHTAEIEKGLLYTSALSDENFIVCFSAFLRTDAKA